MRLIFLRLQMSVRMTFVISKGRLVLGQVTHGKGGNTARGLKMLKRLRNLRKNLILTSQ